MRARGLRNAVGVVLLGTLFTSTAAAQSSAPMNPRAFIAELDRLSSEVSSGEAGRVPDVRVPEVWIVESAGQRVEMPAAWVRRAVDAARGNPSTWPAQRATLLTRIDTLKSEARALASRTAGAPARDPAAARNVLTGVLAGPEFRRMAQESVMARFRQRATQWLLRMWERLGGGLLGRRGTAIVFAWAAVLIALAVLTSWLVRFILRPDRGRRLALTVPGARVRSARAWAHDALTAPDAREAARCAYRATVRGLEEEGAWQTDETRTPREYLRMLPAEHRRRTLVADVMRRFEEIWFGAREATEDDRRAVLARLEELGCLPAD